MPQDVDAFKHVFSLTGSSGQSPCPWCSNCMGRRRYFEDDSGFAHLHSPHYHKFKLKDSETIFLMVDDLERQHGAVRKQREMVYGLIYDPKDLLWCREVRRHLRYPYVIYWDHMHCLCTHGGIAQYHVNQFVYRVSLLLRMPLEEWDKFHKTLEGINPLRKDFFQTRINPRDGAHFKGFASDTLAAMTVIALFIILVLGGTCPAIDRDIQCFWHMFNILQILLRGNIADLPRLKWEIAQHHLLYLVVFPSCLKPKLHYLFHVPACWEYWGCLLSCYGAEADHRDVCKIFRFAMNKPSETSIYHAVYQLFEAVEKCNTYEPVFLMEPLTPYNQECTLAGQTYTATHTSTRLQAAFGIIKAGDRLIWQTGDRRECGKALFFARVEPRTQDIRVEIVCVARLFEKHADGWWYDRGRNMIVSAAAVQFTVAFAQVKLKIWPLIPNI